MKLSMYITALLLVFVECYEYTNPDTWYFVFVLAILQEAVLGKDLKVIQGPCTDAKALAALKKDLQQGRATSSLLFNYKRDGSKFLNYLRAYPLIGDANGTVTHFLGVLQVRCV